MESSLVAPFLELPPSCAALAALANRARPAVRCRTALPQKRRDWGSRGPFHLPVGHSSLVPLARSLLDRSSDAVSGGEAATAHLGRAASAASDAGSPCVGRPESIKLKGPPLRCAQWGTKENGPPGGPREKRQGE